MSAAAETADASWRPKAIVFDLLTGLLDSWSLWDASTPSKSPDEGRPWRKRYLEITFGVGAYEPYEDLVKKAAQEVGLPDSAPENLLREWHNLSPWPEAKEVLQDLKQRGYILGVVTNCSIQRGRIAASRLQWETADGNVEDPFSTVLTAEESGFYKPVKEAYEAVLKQMGMDPSEVLFVAGSSGDVQGANNAGMKVVWHNQVGLPTKGGEPLREGSNLRDALRDFL